ncbi:hypothetical protein BDQ17DRAFT_1451248, partial [Cyathus striatus]
LKLSVTKSLSSSLQWGWGLCSSSSVRFSRLILPLVITAGKSISPPPASKAIVAMLYIYIYFYSMGWGPLPWIYVSDIFSTHTRHYGLALASTSQWLWSTLYLTSQNLNAYFLI